jgi:crotonobetainyl-CoA:carnitine CoA-transferase CaiB-like acyl-CoA transferase
MHFSFGPTPLHAGPAPTLGQHATPVMREVLKLSDEEIAALHAAGVIGENMK